MAISIEPIGKNFGGTVTGVDCRQPLSPETVAAIEAGMDRYAVLVYQPVEKGSYGRISSVSEP